MKIATVRRRPFSESASARADTEQNDQVLGVEVRVVEGADHAGLHAFGNTAHPRGPRRIEILIRSVECREEPRDRDDPQQQPPDRVVARDDADDEHEREVGDVAQNGEQFGSAAAGDKHRQQGRCKEDEPREPIARNANLCRTLRRYGKRETDGERDAQGDAVDRQRPERQTLTEEGSEHG